ncbi:MAG: acyltransferase family protein [Rhodoglobus sp.]
MNSATKPDRIDASTGVTAHRIAGLDGLRAIAVAAVIAYHYLPNQAVGGYIGVDVFFVISGFLITGLLVRERHRTGRIRLRAFWLRRARRLLPALTLLVAGCSAAAFFVGGDVIVGLGRQVLGAATFSSNWLSIARGSSYFGGNSPDLFRNLWSLAVEEQFYLLWPLAMLLLLLVRRRAVRVVIAALVAVASAIAMALLATPDPTRVYYGTDTHSFGLALGAALAFLLEGAFTEGLATGRARRIALPIAGAIAITAIIGIALGMADRGPDVTHGGLAAVAALTAIAIVGATASGSWLGRSLDALPMRWVGERSYGLYLWHWPVFVLFGAALPLSTAWWVLPASALAVTVAAALLSYRFVEMPVRRLGLRGAFASLVPRAEPVRAAAALSLALLVGALSLGGAAIAADPGKTGAEIAVEEGKAAIAFAAAHPRPVAPPSAPAPPAGGNQMYAIGDSVMLAAAPQLQESFPGIAIDAEVSRPLASAPAIVKSIVDSGQLRPIMIIGLGTNGPIDESDLFDILKIVGSKTLMIVVNAQAPRDWIPGVNTTIADFASRERNVELANWRDTIAPRIGELSDDQIHPIGPISGGIYVSAIQAALQRLSELRPLLNANDYKLINRPV